MIHPLTATPPQTQPAPPTGAQALISTLQSALEQAHDLWLTTPAQSAAAAQLCAIDQALQRLVWAAGRLVEE